MRSNQDRAPPGVDYYVEENLAAAEQAIAEQEIRHGDTIMELKEFVCGLIRLSAARYPTTASFEQRLHLLFDEHITPYALDNQTDDAVTQLLQETEICSTIAAAREILQPIFEYYCTADMSTKGESIADAKKSKHLLHTMNMTEFIKFLEESDLFDAKLTLREAKVMFVNVNLDDELDQEQQTAGGDAGTELELDEFEELVARVVIEKRGHEMESERGKGDGHRFEKVFEAFVEESMLPLFRKKKLVRRLKTPEDDRPVTPLVGSHIVIKTEEDLEAERTKVTAD